MFRRAAAVPAVAAAGSARRWLNFTEQSPALEKYARERGFKSNVWVSEADMWWVRKATQLREGETGVEAKLPRRVEMYNGDHVENLPEMPPAMEHTSFGSRREYKNSTLTFELEQRAVTHRLRSKYWVSAGDMHRHKLRAKKDAKAFVLVWSPKSTVVNAEQFENPDAINHAPCSGSSGHLLRAMQQHSEVKEWLQRKGFESGLFFTTPQLQALGLEAVSGSEPFVITTLRNGHASKVYNVSALVDLDAAMGKVEGVDLNVDQHTFLFQKKPVWDFLLPRMEEFVQAHPAECATKLWVSDKDAHYKRVELREDAPYLSLGKELKYFNVEQLTNPGKAFAKAGTITH